jgi:hypothetical protein
MAGGSSALFVSYRPGHRLTAGGGSVCCGEVPPRERGWAFSIRVVATRFRATARSAADWIIPPFLGWGEGGGFVEELGAGSLLPTRQVAKEELVSPGTGSFGRRMENPLGILFLSVDVGRLAGFGSREKRGDGLGTPSAE